MVWRWDGNIEIVAKIFKIFKKLRSFTQINRGSCYVVDRTGMATECTKMKMAIAKQAKLLSFVVKYANVAIVVL